MKSCRHWRGSSAQLRFGRSEEGRKGRSRRRISRLTLLSKGRHISFLTGVLNSHKLVKVVSEVVNRLDGHSLAGRRRIKRERGREGGQPLWLLFSSATRADAKKSRTYLIFRISSVLIFKIPTPTACSFPSAKMATDVSAGRARSGGGRDPPGEVSPGHIMFAPW